MYQLPSLTQYLLESSVCLSVLFVFYYIWLRKEVFFQFNRLYLIGSILTSMVIPILYFKRKTIEVGLPIIEQKVLPILSNFHSSHTSTMIKIDSAAYFDITIGDIVGMIYLMGASALAIKLLNSLLKLQILIKTAKKEKKSNHIQVNCTSDIPASSFFGYIFYNKLSEHDETATAILDHELVHVRQWHTLDVLFMELIVIAKWFNPIVYFYRNSLRKTHEYIADQYVAKQMNNKIGYANILVTYNGSRENLPLVNKFYSFLRERLEMLGQNSNRTLYVIKMAMTLPLVVLLLGLFSFDYSDYANQVIDRTSEKVGDVYNSSMVRIPIDNAVIKDIHLGFQMGDLYSFNFSKSKDNEYVKNDTLSTLQVLESIESSAFFVYHGELVKNFIFTMTITDQNGKQVEIDPNTQSTVEATREFKNKIKNLKKGEVEIQVTYKSENGKSGADLMFKSEIVDYRSSKYPSISSNLLLNNKKPKTVQWGQESFEMVTGAFAVTDMNIAALKEAFEKDVVLEYEEKELRLSTNSHLFEMDLLRKNYSGISHVEEAFYNDVITKNTKYSNIVSKTTIEQREGYIDIVESFNSERLKNRKHPQFVKLLESLKNGDNISIKVLEQMPNTVKEVYNLNITIVEGEEHYKTKVVLESQRNTKSINENSTFQYITTNNGPAIVRMDTTVVYNRPILETYKNNSHFIIKHIPDFSTKYRVISEAPIDKYEITICNPKKIISQLNHFDFPEYISSDEIILKWGRMLNEGMSTNYVMSELRFSENINPTFLKSEGNSTIERFDITIIDKNDQVKRFRTNTIKALEILKTFESIDDNATIVFNNLIIRKEGKTYSLLKSFIYGID